MLYKSLLIFYTLMVMLKMQPHSGGVTVVAGHLPFEGGSGDSEGGDSEDDLSSPDERGSGDISPETGSDDAEEEEEDGGPLRDVIDEFLAIVHKYEKNKESCEPGVKVNLGPGVITQYGVNRFKDQAMLAVNRANFLTRLWKRMPESFLSNEYFFYTQVLSMLEGDEAIFAAGNCYDEHQFGNYTLFCPYALRTPNNTIMVKDLASNYPYLGNDSEFFLIPRQKAQMKLQKEYNVSRGFALYPGDKNVTIDDVIRSEYDDGHWGKPYFDCLGGNIWMMTYTVPFFGYNKSADQYYFKGTSGIDIDLQKVDIDQCPQMEGSVKNVFADTHKCKTATSQCVRVSNLGFRRGSYRCECKRGFYFPNTTKSDRYFNGSDIETSYERFIRNESNEYSFSFSCVKCARGCEECVDGAPCILALHWTQRTIVLCISCFIMCFIPILMWYTVKYRNNRVMKAASPMLLRTILLGAFLLYCPMIVNYFEPTVLSCCLNVWLREIGFAISYGALLLKNWRISVVFRVRSARKIKIVDRDLIKRLILIVIIFASYLSLRMVYGRPTVDKIETRTQGLHSFQCSWNTWDICAAVAELLLLGWGIRLCMIIRNAPSEFNESKFVSWAIYNETLLSLFLNITTYFFLQEPANPDLLYLVLFIHTQLTTTVTLAFLFCTKAYLVYKYREKSQPVITFRCGSKYMAAPMTTAISFNFNSNSPNNVNNSNAADRAASERLCDAEVERPPSKLEKDIQDEFKRLYKQLEILKQRNMKIGNPHIGSKLSAMTEAANKEDQTDDTPPQSPVPSPSRSPGRSPGRSPARSPTRSPSCSRARSPSRSPNMNGKRITINLDDFTDSTSCL